MISKECDRPVDAMKKVSTAYILWLGGLFGFAGLHRFYTGRIWTGILWFFTWGLFGFGQFVDLLLIPKMIGVQPAIAPQPTPQPLQNSTLITLLQAAESRGGKLSVTQGVMATGINFTEMESLLKGMLNTGYVEICNDPETGTVLYEFKELT
jgi:TM2 domain-containing membrane protein YozV